MRYILKMSLLSTGSLQCNFSDSHDCGLNKQDASVSNGNASSNS